MHLPTQNVVQFIYLSHSRGTNPKASPLGSLIYFINDTLNLEFFISLEQPNHASPPEAKKKKPSYESTCKFQVSWGAKLP